MIVYILPHAKILVPFLSLSTVFSMLVCIYIRSNAQQNWVEDPKGFGYERIHTGQQVLREAEERRRQRQDGGLEQQGRRRFQEAERGNPEARPEEAD